MPAKCRPGAVALCPFSPVDQSQIDRWIEDATKAPPRLFDNRRAYRNDLAKMVGGERGAQVIEHVCKEFQLWSGGNDARLSRLQFAVASRGPISASGEFSLIEPTGKAGKRSNQAVVALVDFLVPVLLALGVPWGSTTSAKMTRALDVVAVDLLGLTGTKSELQKRQRDHRTKLAEQRAARQLFAGHRASFEGPPKPHGLMAAEFSAEWKGLLPSQRASIRAAVARGLEALKIQPPQDIRPIR
jgi:hypothetical protein